VEAPDWDEVVLWTLRVFFRIRYVSGTIRTTCLNAEPVDRVVLVGLGVDEVPFTDPSCARTVRLNLQANLDRTSQKGRNSSRSRHVCQREATGEDGRPHRVGRVKAEEAAKRPERRDTQLNMAELVLPVWPGVSRQLHRRLLARGVDELVLGQGSEEGLVRFQL
jgi:hypothetical protein